MSDPKMLSAQTLPLEKPRAQRPSAPRLAGLFYSGAAAFLLIVMLLGFQQFYLHGKAYPGRELTPPIRTLVILHGIGMTAWMLLFLSQPLLIVNGGRRAHMLFGRAGAVLAAGLVFIGLKLGIDAARVNPPAMKLWGLVPKQFMIIPVSTILMFAVFVIIGVWNRRRPKVHRPMMLLGTLAAITAALDRIGPIRDLYAGTIWGTLFGPFFAALLFGLLLLIVHSLLTRTLDRSFAIGYAALCVAGALIMRLATTPVWDHVATFLLR